MCPISVTEPKSPNRYTHLVSLRFSNATNGCNFNYSLRLKSSAHKYFTEPPNTLPVSPRVEYRLDVLELIKPYFIYNTGKNLTFQMANGSTSNANNTVVMTTNDIKVKSDETIMLNCEAYGRPKPKVIWYKNSKLLAEDKYKFINGSLQIFRTHPSDTGFYECDVNNRHGSLSRSFNVEVEIGPQKSLSKRQIAIIWASSIGSALLFVLLVLAIAYGCMQKIEKEKLYKKHKNFIRFLNGGEDLDDADLEDELLINTKLDNIQKIKFDDKKWEIDPTRFIIHGIYSCFFYL